MKIIKKISYAFLLLALSVQLPAVAAGAKKADATQMPQGEPVVVGNADAGKALATPCAACHGADGNSLIPENPNIAGQGLQYLHKQLTEFSSGTRVNAVMAAQLANLSDEQLLDLATYYAQQAPKYSTAEDDESLVIAQRLYRAGDAERSITACTACHGPSGLGNAPAKFPAIAGQHRTYVAAQLRAFRAVARGDHADVLRDNDPEGMMRDVVKTLTDDEIDALANYIQGLQP